MRPCLQAVSIDFVVTNTKRPVPTVLAEGIIELLVKDVSGRNIEGDQLEWQIGSHEAP